MKKKLIALLLAIVMVVAMLPATVISAMDLASADENVADNAGTTTEGDTSSAETPIVDDDTEVFEDDRTVITDEPTEEHYFAVVNAAGNVVGYYATLADADAALKDGDTIKLLQDYAMTEQYTFASTRVKYNEDYWSSADSAMPISYTIDGTDLDGVQHMISVTLPSNNVAFHFSHNSDGDQVTFRNLFMVSNYGCIGLYCGSGSGMRGVIENCQIYAGNMYWMENPEYYNNVKPSVNNGFGVDASTINTYLSIGGEDTVIMAGNYEAVKSAGILTIYDGYFYGAGNQTVWEYVGDPGKSGANDHKVLIYGGTFVNETRACVLASANAQAYIMGGTFIQVAKNKNTDATCIMSGWKNHGHVYVTGGTFWLNWLATSGMPAPVYVQNNTAAATVTGGEFYYTSLGKPVSGVDGASVKLGTYSELVGEAVNLETLTVRSFYSEDHTKLITANYHATVECTVTPELVTPEAVAPDKNGNVAEVIIYDKDGNIQNALDVDDDTTNGIWSCAIADGGNEYTSYATVAEEFGRSFYMVPEGGTYSVHADITFGQWNRMCHATGDVTFTLQGNGHTITNNDEADYWCYGTGGNVTFLNVNMVNNTGRGMQFGGNRHNPITWTLGEGAKVYARSGSAAYLNTAATLVMLDGSELKSDDSYKGEHNALMQMVGTATFIMKGGKLDHTSAQDYFDEQGFVKDTVGGDWSEVIRAWRVTQQVGANDARTRYYDYNGITIQLLGGEIQTAHGVSHLLRRQDNNTTVDFKVADTVFTYHEWNPETEQIEKQSFTAKESDSVSLLDENGDLVCVFDSIEETLPYIKDGYTVKLLANVVELHPLRLNLKDVSWTLDFNGYSYYYYAGGQALIYVFGENQDLLMKNGNIYSNNNILELGTNDGFHQNIVLENMGIFSGGTTHVNDVGVGSANSYFWIRGYNTRVVIRGEDTVVRSSRRTTIINQGAQLEIYDGEFTTHAGYGVIETTEQTKPATNSNIRTQGNTTIYGGTFISGGYTTNNYDTCSRTVVRALWGSTLYIGDGNFIYRSATNSDENGTNMLRGSAESTNGYIFVLGGNFYNAHETRPIYGGGQPALAFFRFFGGTFYSVADSEIKSEKIGDKTHWNFHNFQTYYGSFYDEFYTPTSEQGEFIFGADSGVHPAAQGITYNNKYTLAYDTEFITSTWGDIYNGDPTLRVSYGYTTSDGVVVDRTRDLYGFELEAAVWSVGHEGAVTLLADTEWNNYKHTTSTSFPTTKDEAAYAIFLPAHHTDFEWTLNSAAENGDYYTLTVDAYNKYAFFTYGGVFNIENMTLQNISGRVLELHDWFGNIGTVNVQNGGEVSGYSECAIHMPNASNIELNVRDNGWVNAVDSSIYSGSGSAGNCIIKHAAPKGVSRVNIFDGGHVGYGRDGSFRAGGETHGDAKGWMAVRMTTIASELNVYGGKLYGNYNSNATGDRYATILTWGTNGGRGSIINIYGGDIYSECSYALYNGQTTTQVNIYGGYLHNNIPADIGGVDYRTRVLHSNAGNVTIWGGTFEQEGGGAQCVQLANWPSGDETGGHYIYGGEFIGGTDTFNFGDAAKVTFDSGIHPITGEETCPVLRDSTSAMIGANAGASALLTINDIKMIGNGKQAIYCGNMPIVINGGTFGSFENRTGTSLNVMHGSSTSDITVNGGTFYGYHFLALRGNGVRDITLNGGYVDTSATICNWQTNADYKGNPSRVVFNGGYYTNATTDSGWGIFNDTNATAVGTNLTINGGEFYHSGSSRMMKWYGQSVININGGYFWNDSTSDLIQTEPSTAAYITISGGEFVNESGSSAFYMQGGGYLIFREGKDAEGNVTVPKITSRGHGIRVFADNMPLLIQNMDMETVNTAIVTDTADVNITHIINGGSIKSNVYCVQTAAGNTAGLVINGGSFSSIKGTNGPDACVSIAGGKCTINAGTFEGNGMCVVRVLGGSTDNEYDLNGSIKTESTAVLEINGGVFHLLEADRTPVYDAVVRCGGGSTYGWVTINGGTFINDRDNSEQVVLKNNVHASLYINGGLFLASNDQPYYINSYGRVGDAAYPFDGAVEVKASDMTMTFGEGTYFALMINPADEDTPAMQTGAQARLYGDNLGLRFVSRIDAETVAKYAAMEGVTVIYGTLIAPLDYVMEANGTFTMAALDAAGLCYLDVEATEGGGIIHNADGSITIRAAIANIKAENRDRAFAAVSYVKVIDENGNATVAYGAFNNNDNARSLSEIAEKSLADVQELYGIHGGVRYIYESLVHEGMYSRYTADQQKALMACIPAYDAE